MPIEVVFIEVHLPSQAPALAGLVLIDTVRNQVEVRMSDCSWFVDNSEEAEILSLYPEMLNSMLHDLGGDVFMDQIETTLSNLVRVSTRLQVHPGSDDIVQSADRLFAALCGGPSVP